MSYNMIKTILLLFLQFALINTYAQDDKSVTLTVTGQGKTLDEAKQNALRSAIEQAFGAFISSKTEILNDNLVKDEIISVSNGNIQKFDVISEIPMPEVGFATTLKATVSVSKLTSFVESKGVVTEFKGKLFAFNVNQQILNEENEIKAVKDMCNVLKQIMDISFDFTINASQPTSINGNNDNWLIPYNVHVIANKNFINCTNYLYKSLMSLSLYNDEAVNYIKLNKEAYSIYFGCDESQKSMVILRNKESLNEIIRLLYYLNFSTQKFKISNGIEDWTIKSKVGNLKKIDDKNFRFFLKQSKEHECRNGFLKYGSVFYTSKTSSVNDSKIILNYEDWYIENKKWDGYGHVSQTGVIAETFLEDISCVRNAKFLYEKDLKKRYSFVNKIPNNFPWEYKFKFEKALVISFIGYNPGDKMVEFVCEDVRSLGEINRISEYKIIPINK
jgi:hypothetical protein